MHFTLILICSRINLNIIPLVVTYIYFILPIFSLRQNCESSSTPLSTKKFKFLITPLSFSPTIFFVLQRFIFSFLTFLLFPMKRLLWVFYGLFSSPLDWQSSISGLTDSTLYEKSKHYYYSVDLTDDRYE